MDKLVLCLFCAVLIVCVALDVSVIVALIIGLCIFLAYAKKKGFSASQMAALCMGGVKTVHNILITLLLIGIMTALWRASGCIPAIVSYSSGLISPGAFLLLSFLLNALISTLTGSSFACAATMGIISMSVGNAMGIPAIWTGGTILSGAHVGDRCSPVSTSALLVSAVTETDIYFNIKTMIRTEPVPIAMCCGIYLIAGFFTRAEGAVNDIRAMFENEFVISPLCVLPALIIIAAASFRLDVKISTLLSIIAAFIIAVAVQGASVKALFGFMMTGFVSGSDEIAAMTDGGGMLSMISVICIVAISSCFSGLFRATGLLDFMKDFVSGFAEKHGNFRAVLLASIPVSAISCSQSLAIMFTRNVADGIDEPEEELAIDLENSAVLVAPLIPWSIAGAVPIAMSGASTSCLLLSCYLYILPLWCALREKPMKRVIRAMIEKERGRIARVDESID